MGLVREHEPDVAAIVAWFGCKRTGAFEIVREIGPHHTWFEVFCGSLAVTLAKPKVRMEAANDLHGDVVNLARVIQDRRLSCELYKRARRTWMCEQLMREAAARWKERGVKTPAPETPDLERAFDFFYSSWVGRNGVIGTKSYNQGFAMRYTPGGGHGGTRWQSAVSSIPAWRRRLQDLTITNRDGFALLEKIDDADGVAIYCDPPYLEKGAEYVFDFEAEDHERLAGLVRRFTKARVVVSYYDHPKLAELYPGWTKREVFQTKAMVNEGMRGKGNGVKTVAPEVLLINGPSYAGGGLFQ